MLRCGDVLCPLCGGSLKFHGSYQRHFIDELSKRHNGWVAQSHCALCKIYPALLPDFLMPYKHFKAQVIEEAILEAEEKEERREGEDSEELDLSDCPADDATIRRWINQFKERGARAVGFLLSMLFRVYERHISMLELQNKGLLKQLAHLLQQFPIPGAGTIIGQVNAILTKHTFHLINQSGKNFI